MKNRIKFFTLLLVLLTPCTLFASNSRESKIQNVLYWADWLKQNEYTTYADYENELNFDTIDAPVDDKYEFAQTEIYYTKKANVYCTEIYLKGIKDRMLAMLQIEGSGWFPYLKIFRFDSKKQKWTIYYSGKGPLGECGVVYPIRHPITGYTFFFEQKINYDNKRLISYDLLSLENKKWKVTESVKARYVYNLTDEQKEWISPELIEKMAAFDYSFLGYKKDHPGTIELIVNDRKIVAKLYHTSVGRMASNYDITVYSREREVFKKNEKVPEEEKVLLTLGTQWGLNIVEKDNKSYLVYIGFGAENRASIENLSLNVIDLSSLKTVHQSYANCDILFE